MVSHNGNVLEEERPRLIMRGDNVTLQTAPSFSWAPVVSIAVEARTARFFPRSLEKQISELTERGEPQSAWDSFVEAAINPVEGRSMMDLESTLPMVRRELRNPLRIANRRRRFLLVRGSRGRMD